MGWQGISLYQREIKISSKSTQKQLGNSIVLQSSPVKIKTWFGEFNSKESAKIFFRLERDGVKIDELTLFSGIDTSKYKEFFDDDNKFLQHCRQSDTLSLYASSENDDFVNISGLLVELHNETNIILECKKIEFSDATKENKWAEKLVEDILASVPIKITARADRFYDQGWGNNKGKLFLMLERDNKEFKSLDLFGPARRGLEAELPVHSEFTSDNDFLQECIPGDKLILVSHTGPDGGHTLTAENIRVVLDYNYNENDCYPLINAKQSSTLPNSNELVKYSATNALNGIPSIYSQTSGDKDQWWQAELMEESVIGDIVISSRSIDEGPLKNVKVTVSKHPFEDVSNDSHGDCIQLTVSEFVRLSESLTFANGFTAKYIKIELPKGQLSLGRVEILCPTPQIPKGKFRILSCKENLSVTEVETENNYELQLQEKSNSDNQTFFIEKAEGWEKKYFRIRTLASGNYVTSTQGMLSTITIKPVKERVVDLHQLFRLRSVGSERIAFECVANGLAMDISGCSFQPDTKLQVYTPLNTPAQSFTLEDIKAETVKQTIDEFRSEINVPYNAFITKEFRIQASNGMVIEQENDALVLSNRTSSNNQLFSLDPHRNGMFRIICSASGLCLTAKHESNDNGPLLLCEFERLDDQTQLFTVTENTDCTVTFINQGSAIDVPMSKFELGNCLHVYAVNMTYAQRFTMVKEDINKFPSVDEWSIARSNFRDYIKNDLYEVIIDTALEVKESLQNTFDNLRGKEKEDYLTKLLKQTRVYSELAKQKPLEMLPLCPYFNRDTAMKYHELVLKIQKFYFKKEHRDILSKNQYTWCIPLHAAWVETASKFLKRAIKVLRFDQAEWDKFLQCFQEFLKSYNFNKERNSSVLSEGGQLKGSFDDLVNTLKSRDDVRESSFINELEKEASFNLNKEQKKELNMLLNKYDSVCDVKKNSNVLEISAPVIVVSVVKNHILENLDCSEFQLLASEVLYMDTDLNTDSLHGKNIAICTNHMEIIGDHTIDVSGKDGGPAPSKASNGTPGQSHGDSQEKRNGTNGSNGVDAQPGESGGNIYIKSQTRGDGGTLALVSNGGSATPAQEGGNGGPGGAGKDGAEGNPTKPGNFSSFHGWQRLEFGKPGEAGGKGGNGGDGGYSAEGGYAGSIEFDLPSENDMTKTQLPGAFGPAGEPGYGADGGKDGRDGMDKAIYKLQYGFGDSPNSAIYETQRGKLVTSNQNWTVQTIMFFKNYKTFEIDVSEDDFKRSQDTKQSSSVNTNKGSPGNKRSQVNKTVKKNAILKQEVTTKFQAHVNSGHVISQSNIMDDTLKLEADIKTTLPETKISTDVTLDQNVQHSIYADVDEEETDYPSLLLQLNFNKSEKDPVDLTNVQISFLFGFIENPKTGSTWIPTELIKTISKTLFEPIEQPLEEWIASLTFLSDGKLNYDIEGQVVTFQNIQYQIDNLDKVKEGESEIIKIELRTENLSIEHQRLTLVFKDDKIESDNNNAPTTYKSVQQDPAVYPDPFHLINIIRSFVTTTSIDNFETIIKENVESRWATKMAKELLRNKMFEVFATTTNLNVFIDELERFPVDGNSYGCVLHALYRYIGTTEQKSREPLEHFLLILEELVEVRKQIKINDINSMEVYNQLIQLPVSKWHLALRSTNLQLKLLLSANKENGISFVRQMVMQLDAIESQFGAAIMEQIKNQIFSEPDLDFEKTSNLLKSRICGGCNANALAVVTDHSPGSWDQEFEKSNITVPVHQWEAKELEDIIYKDLRNHEILHDLNGNQQDVDLIKLIKSIREYEIQLLEKGKEFHKDVNEEELTDEDKLEMSRSGYTKDTFKRAFGERKMKLANEIKNNSSTGLELVKTSAFVEVCAWACTARQLLNGYHHRDTQLISVALSILQGTAGSLLEIGTGEGKTDIVAVIAILSVLRGCRVDIVTSSSMLAKRDARENTSFFDLFDICVSNNCAEDSKTRTKSYRTDIVYGDASAFQRDILMDEFCHENIRGDRMYDVVIVDEVDSMLLDKADSMLYLSRPIPGMQYLESFFVAIWSGVQASDVGYGSEQDIDTVKIFVNKQVNDGIISAPKYLECFYKRRLTTWIKSAFVAKVYLEENDEYTIERGKNLVTMDKDTGVSLRDTHLSEGVHQFLQLKHLLRYEPETLKSIFMSNFSFFKLYTNGLYGVSGTMGSEIEKQLLVEKYNVHVGYIPTFQEKQLIIEQPVTTKDKKEHIDAIKQSIEEHKGRPILVINDSIEASLKVNDSIKNISGRSVVLYTTDAVKPLKNLNEKHVVVSTNLAGRGTDFKISKDLSEKGGLHVIVTYCPDNLRVERQAFGRAGRAGQKGSAQCIVLKTLSGSTMDELVFSRNQNEIHRLENLKNFKLAEKELEEELLKKFNTNVLKSVSGKTDAVVNEIYFNDKLEQFSLWLDFHQSTIESLKNDSSVKDVIIKNLDEMIKNSKAQDEVLVNDIHAVKLGTHYISKKNSEEAVKYFDMVINREPEFCEAAYFYRSAALVNVHGSTEENIAKVCDNLYCAEVKIKKRVLSLSNNSRIVREIKKLIQKKGSGLPPDIYTDQVQDKIDIYQVIMSSIQQVTGSRELDISQVTSLKLTEDENQKLQTELIKNENLFTRLGLNPEFGFTKDSLMAQFKLPKYTDDLKSDIIELVLKNNNNIAPEIFKDILQTSDALLKTFEDNGVIESLPQKRFTFLKSDFIEIVKTEESNEMIDAKLLQLCEWRSLVIKTEGGADFVDKPLTSLSYDSAKNTFKMATEEYDEIAIHMDDGFKIIESVDVAGKNYDRPNIYIVENFKSAKVLKNCEAKVKECFKNESFIKRFNIQESLKNWLLEAQEDDGTDDQIISQTSINLLKEGAAANQVIALLTCQGFVHDQYSKKMKKEEVQKHVAKHLKEIGYEKAVDDIVDSVNDIIEAMKNAFKALEDEDDVQASLTKIVEKLSAEKDYSLSKHEELKTFLLLGLESLVEIKPKPCWWGPLAVALLGLAQVLAGAILIWLGMPNLGAVLISEGIGDIMFAIEAQMSGNFSWKSYGQHKVISLCMSALTFGIGSCLAVEVEVAQLSFKAALKAGGKEAVKKLAEAAVDKTTEKIVEKATEEGIKNIRKDIETALFKSVDKDTKELEDLICNAFQKTRNQKALQALIKRHGNKAIKEWATHDDVTGKISKVTDAVTSGLTNALQIRQQGGASFKAIQLIATVFEKVVEAAKYGEAVIHLCNTTTDFIDQAKITVRNETQSAPETSREVTSEEMEVFQKAVQKQLDEWKKQLLDRLILLLTKNLATPLLTKAVKHGVKKLQEHYLSGFKDYLKDEAAEKAIQNTREQNLSKLTKHEIFVDGKTVEQILAKDKTIELVSYDENSKTFLDSNIAGCDYTVGQLKEMTPGVRFVKKGGEYIMVPPDISAQPMPLSTLLTVYPDFYKQDKYKISRGEEQIDHVNPIIDGEEIRLEAADPTHGGKVRNKKIDDGNCAVRATMFHEKYESEMKKLRTESPEESEESLKTKAMTSAKSFVQDERRVYEHKNLMLMKQMELITENTELRSIIASSKSYMGHLTKNGRKAFEGLMTRWNHPEAGFNKHSRYDKNLLAKKIKDLLENDLEGNTDPEILERVHEIMPQVAGQLLKTAINDNPRLLDNETVVRIYNKGTDNAADIFNDTHEWAYKAHSADWWKKSIEGSTKEYVGMEAPVAKLLNSVLNEKNELRKTTANPSAVLKGNLDGNIDNILNIIKTKPDVIDNFPDELKRNIAVAVFSGVAIKDQRKALDDFHLSATFSDYMLDNNNFYRMGSNRDEAWKRAIETEYNLHNTNWGHEVSHFMNKSGKSSELFVKGGLDSSNKGVGDLQMFPASVQHSSSQNGVTLIWSTTTPPTLLAIAKHETDTSYTIQKVIWNSPLKVNMTKGGKVPRSPLDNTSMLVGKEVFFLEKGSKSSYNGIYTWQNKP